MNQEEVKMKMEEKFKIDAKPMRQNKSNKLGLSCAKLRASLDLSFFD